MEALFPMRTLFPLRALFLRALVKRERDLPGADAVAADIDQKIAAGFGYGCWDEGHGDAGLEEWGGRAGCNRADSVSVRGQYGVPVAGYAALNHLEANDFSFRAAGFLHGRQSLTSNKRTF